jgi:SAM-dependent methyltransferase
MEMRQTICVLCGSSAYMQVASGRDYIYHGSNEYFSHVSCVRCGHVYMNPQPTENEITIMYPPDYGTFSGKFRGNLNLLARIKNIVNLKRFSKIAGILQSGACVLDVGCGNGELLRALAGTRPDLKLWGLDWHFPEETRRELGAVGIQLIEGTLENVVLPREHFDLVLMYQLIEHLWEPRLGLTRLAQALKPEGRIAIETPDTDGYDRRFFAGGAWGGYYVPRHLNLFNFERLARLLTEVGFDVVQQTSLPAPVIWCYSFQAVLQERYGDNTIFSRLFDLKNLIALGFFAVLDTLAAYAGLRTSNQQAVAKKNRCRG